MREKDFSIETATKHVQDIVRRNAEGLIACGVSSTEAEREIIRFLPQLQSFANDFTDFGSAGKGRKSIDQLATLERHGAPSTVRFVANDVTQSRTCNIARAGPEGFERLFELHQSLPVPMFRVLYVPDGLNWRGMSNVHKTTYGSSRLR
jgi:hypothetical protein